MDYSPKASINLSALKHNLSRVRQLAPGLPVMAVIKANAYGHGVMDVAGALSDADMFAVARLDEAIRLRQSGIDKQLLLLEGVFNQQSLLLAAQHDLQLTIHQQQQLDLLASVSSLDLSGYQFKAWLKIDTGMHRLGFRPEQTVDAHQQLSSLETVQGRVKILTHLACADDVNNDYSSKQIKEFSGLLDLLGNLSDEDISIANSAGIVAWPDSCRGWLRPGIMLYGSSPLLDKSADELALKPVMTLSSQLIAINQHKKGSCIGYGSSWCCPEDMPVGVVAIGYGDGYPRHAPAGTPVLINGQSVPLIGRVSMDMITVDLRDVKADIGDEVILWSDGLSADDIAKLAGTISYELFCGVTSRVKFEVSHG